MSTSTIKVTSISPSEGSLNGNNQITLEGKGFSSIASPLVNFGTAGATDIQVVSDTKMTLKNPNTGTAGQVDVTLVDGANSYPAKTFTYKLPEITGLEPSSSSLQGNKTITIKGKYLTGTEAVNFGLAGASAVQVINDNKVTAVNPNAPKNEQVHVTAIVQGKTSLKTQADEFNYTSADAQGVPMVFSGASPATTFIQFIGDTNLSGSYYDGATLKDLQPNTAYSLTDITGTKPVATGIPSGVPAVIVKAFSGRVYINFGSSGLSNMEPDYTPNAAHVTGNNPNYHVRYQYFEPTINNSQMNVDLSYIDFTAISLSLKTVNAPHATNGNQISQSSLKLAKATGGAAATKDGSVLPSSADQLPNASFARVISPQLGEDGLYHDFTHYLQKVLAGKSVRIAGTYVGTGAQPSGHPLTQAQSYDYTAKFTKTTVKGGAKAGSVTLTPNTGSGDGTAPGVAKVQQGPGVGTGGGDITISFDALNNKTGIYGCNTPYKLGTQPETKGITNDIYGQVVGDLLAGLNFGYIGSSQLFNGSAIGDLASTEWWGGTMPDGTVITSDGSPGGNGMYFEKVQSNALNYNSYAGSIDQLTSGYGFPLQDRLGRNLLTMNSATDTEGYLKIYIDTTPAS
jgi:hypothetical protein